MHTLPMASVFLNREVKSLLYSGVDLLKKQTLLTMVKQGSLVIPDHVQGIKTGIFA